MKIITRETALKQGLAWYFTGKPCKYGHVTKRHVNGRGCTDCNKENQRARRARNPERVRAQWRAWRARDRERQ
jgi:hypothetical protein